MKAHILVEDDCGFSVQLVLKDRKFNDVLELGNFDTKKKAMNFATKVVTGLREIKEEIQIHDTMEGID